MEDDDLPFSPEMGSAVPFRSGFAAGALEPAPGGEKAVVVLVGSGGPERVDLGPVHGDVGPPVVAAAKDSLIAAVMDGAPAGALARLAKIDVTGSDVKVAWGSELPQGHDESDVFSMDLGEKNGVLVWDEAEDLHSVVRAATVSLSDPKKASSPRLLSAKGEDADSPFVTPRQGGFWVGWISSGKIEKKTRAPSPVPSQRAEDPNENADLVETGPRFVTILPLDDAGQAVGAPIAVTARSGRVMGFDLVEGAGGGALLAVRDQVSTRGPGGSVVRTIYVRPDGTSVAQPIGEEDVGTTAPVFLVDALPSGEKRLWLALSTDSEALRLVPIDSEGHTLGEWSTETALGAGAPLAMSNGRLLAVRPRAGGVALDLFQCDPGALDASKEPTRP